MGLDGLIKRAIVNEVNEIVKERERKMNQKEKDLEMQMAKVNSELKLKDMSNTAIGRLMNR